MKKEEKQKRCKHIWNIAFEYSDKVMCGKCSKIRSERYKKIKTKEA